MSRGLRIMYNSRVQEIRYSKQEIAVRTPMHIFRGDLQALNPFGTSEGQTVLCQLTSVTSLLCTLLLHGLFER